jgi:hypothetical protein
MIIGAGITRYFGWEGMMHIREGEAQNIVYSRHNIIGYDLIDNQGKTVSSLSKKYNISSVSADNFKTSVKIGGEKYRLELSRIIPNAEESITLSPNGEPIISMIVTTDMFTNEIVTLSKGEKQTVFGVVIGLETEGADINIKCESGNFYATAEGGLSIINMMGGEQEPATSDTEIQLMPMRVLTFGELKIVPQVMEAKGSLRAVAANSRERITGAKAFIFNIFNNSDSRTVILWDV